MNKPESGEQRKAEGSPICQNSSRRQKCLDQHSLHPIDASGKFTNINMTLDKSHLFALSEDRPWTNMAT